MIGKMSAEEVEELLKQQVVGRIGCFAEEKTYVVPITYAYYDGFVYGHSAEGRKIKMMRANHHICFQVDRITGLNDWQSVIAWGTYEELKTDEARQLALNILMSAIAHQRPSATMRPAHRMPEPHPHPKANKAIAFRIFLREKSGRFEKPF